MTGTPERGPALPPSGGVAILAPDSTDPRIPRPIVSGFGRCGSTLVMRMLVAGGARALADHASSLEAVEVTTALGWLRVLARDRYAPPAAVKGLYPCFPPPESGPYAFIWLDRDSHEQAASHAKFMQHVVGVRLRRDQQRAWQRSLVRDRAAALEKLRSYPESTLTILSFERVLAEPIAVARELADLLPHHRIEPDAMVRVVARRSPACLRGFLEMRP